MTDSNEGLEPREQQELPSSSAAPGVAEAAEAGVPAITQEEIAEHRTRMLALHRLDGEALIPADWKSLQARRVERFMHIMGQAMPQAPSFPEEEVIAMRIRLLREELDELMIAVAMRDMVHVADGAADLLYVLYGFASAFGFNLDAVFTLVHQANLTKLGTDGMPIYREDGKVLKGPYFVPPESLIRVELMRQGWTPPPT